MSYTFRVNRRAEPPSLNHEHAKAIVLYLEQPVVAVEC